MNDTLFPDDDGTLIGPELREQPPLDPAQPIVVIPKDPDATWMMQFVNRWVFLPEQRPSALRQLQDFVAEIKERGSQA